MPFVLAPMTEEDIPTFAIVDEYALKDNPMARAMETPGTPRRVVAEQWTRAGWGKDPNQQWMKVTDTETGDMVAAAAWKFVRNPEDEKQNKEEQAAPEAEAGETISVPPKEEKKVSNEVSAIMADMRASWEDFRKEFIGDQPYASMHALCSPFPVLQADLMILVTHPKYQRRGAGSMLVKWGCDRADEDGMMAVLQATAAGVQVYTKHGFEIVKVREMDLRPYGIEDTELRRGMVRQPKSNK